MIRARPPCVLALLVASPSLAQPCQPRWNSLPGGGLSGGKYSPIVYALTVFDDGRGPALYAGGRFALAGGAPAPSLARWDGVSWSAVPGSPDGPQDEVRTLAVFDEGSGPALYVGGRFSQAGGLKSPALARWDGQSWSPVGGGLGTYSPSVLSMTIADRGMGRRLVVGGDFDRAGNDDVGGIAEWDGAHWSSLQDDTCCYWVWLAGGIDPTFWGLTAFRSGDADTIIGVGIVGDQGAQGYNAAARGADSWTFLDDEIRAEIGGNIGFGCGFTRLDEDLTVTFLGGGIEYPPDRYRAGVVQYSEGHWFALPSFGDLFSKVYCLLDYHDSDGRALYAGGNFAEDLGAVSDSIVRWDGSRWSPVGSGLLPAPGYYSGVRAMAVYDDGSGPALYAAGGIIAAAGGPIDNIARWSCPACYPDFDFSGSLDLFDFLSFISLYAAADPAADCDNSGGLDLFDFLCFINAFIEGC